MKEVTVEHICTMPQFPEGWHGRTSSPSGHVSGRVGQLVPDNQDIKIVKIDFWQINNFLKLKIFKPCL